MELLSRMNTGEAAPCTWDFLAHGGQMSALLQSGSLVNSPLGLPDQWPACLKTLMSTVLPVQAQIVVFWGPEYVALYNDAYAPTIGNKHPAALGRPAIEHWRELWDDLEPLLRGVRETGQTFSAKDRPFYIERHGRGENVWFDVSYSAVREADGSVGGVLCIVTETTERVQFERRQAFALELGKLLPSITAPRQIQTLVLTRLCEVLGDAQAFLVESASADDRLVAHRSADKPDLCLRLQLNTQQLTHLQAGKSVLQATPEQAISTVPASRLLVPVLRHGQLEAVLDVQRNRPTGFDRHEVLLAEEAAKLGWLWIDHARAEAALRTSSAQLSAMFDQAGAGIAVCDPSGALVRVNDQYCEIIGRRREELLHLPIEAITHPDDAALHTLAGGHNLDNATPFEITKRYTRPDGRLVWVQNHITPLHDDRQQFNGLLCVCVDISARIKAELELRELNDSLEQRVVASLAEREQAIVQLHESRKLEMIGQLSGGMAHDFNNLLTPIMASLELIRRRSPDPQHSRLIDGALQAADRARILVGRLLTFGRRQTLKPQAVALHSLVNDMNELIERSLGPLFEVLIDIPDALPAVFVDPHQLELSVLNLAVNARDAMDEGGQLSITAELAVVTDGQVNGLGAGTYVQLVVADNGRGMDEDTLKHCVEPFYSTKGVGKGTGLGLSMVQGLALQSGGGFDITSQDGQGTQVMLWLPVTEAVVARETDAQASAPVAPCPTHILLVDDEDLARYATALQLRDLGYQVTDTATAHNALQMIEAGLRPDLLITDHLMANKTGAQLAVEVRQSIPHLPVLIITGYANLKPAQLQAFEVLAKPFRRDDIAARVARLIERTV
ncbi:PAS domain S-box protein [Pseudomonas syringae]|nr:PAS domain S-box protein [Pseudomonas syringae]MBD8789348.1 PAS domain S-box protein [Pseudomonas syringae]MBD8800228.1 PAS domain S-box protein [Pseudomonas syringae]MBD8810776.1 PAS domain S-box protein [Pseudomonas syringae]